jgi:hypothetical protein
MREDQIIGGMKELRAVAEDSDFEWTKQRFIDQETQLFEHFGMRKEDGKFLYGTWLRENLRVCFQPIKAKLLTLS